MQKKLIDNNEGNDMRSSSMKILDDLLMDDTLPTADELVLNDNERQITSFINLNESSSLAYNEDYSFGNEFIDAIKNRR